MAATGLFYTKDVYDKERYEHLQEMAMEMAALATGQPLETLLPLKTTLFSRMSPLVAGSAAVINKDDKILLMRRTDNHLWSMPAGGMEVGETPAEAVVRETFEETGIRCIPKALSGVYDSRLWKPGSAFHVYRATFWCEPLHEKPEIPFNTLETLEIGWFAENNLPPDLIVDHATRISHAYRVRAGKMAAYFDCL